MATKISQRYRIAWCGACGNVSADGLNFVKIPGIGMLRCAACGAEGEFAYTREAGPETGPGLAPNMLSAPLGDGSGGAEDNHVMGWKSPNLGEVVAADEFSVTLTDADAKVIQKTCDQVPHLRWDRTLNDAIAKIEVAAQLAAPRACPQCGSTLRSSALGGEGVGCFRGDLHPWHLSE